MDIVEKSLESQLANIQERTGRSMDELFAILEESGLEKHGQLRDLLKRELGMGHGDANTVVHTFRQQGDDAPRTVEGELDRIYSGDRAVLRAIHDRIMERIQDFGPFDVSAKKAYVSLRRKKQFATVGPATKTQVEIGLIGELEPGGRLQEQKPGRMTTYKVRVSNPDEVDDELIDWMRHAFESAG
ncbi:MAG: DUF5655 domain-containing protein [Longimicrobiales bacterium]|nr:DUF5655 domain-containing protein [Longimicrobiales bacterium]